MASYLEHSYSIVHQDNTADQPTIQELKTQLEKGTDEAKVDTMKRILTIMLNGDPMPLLLMHIIRFVMPSKSKPLKKLLYLYYEICPKLDTAGKLKQEMILVWYVHIRWCLYVYLGIDHATVMASVMICNILMNTFVAIPYASFANFESQNLSSRYYPLPDHVLNTDMPMYGRMPCSLFPRYTSCQKYSYQMPPISYRRS